MTNSTAYMSATELLSSYRRCELSPVTVIDEVLARAAKLDPVLNAFCLIDAERARAQAKASEKRWAEGKPIGPMDGVPVSIKDLVLTKGWPTLRGSLTISADQLWDEDAPQVARLAEAGAVIYGKTNTPEYGWKGITDNPRHGTTRNPWNSDHSPGGSSGGGAAAVAAGMGTLALGNDGGGSIRIPASHCGLYGIKPTFGRVPNHSQDSPFCTLIASGPLTRTVSDAALMLNVLAQPDARDWYSLPYDGADYLQGLGEGVQGLRIAYSPTLGGARPDAEVAAAVEAAAGRFASLGADVEQVGDIFDPLRPVFEDYWKAGFAHILREIDEDKRELIDPGLRELAEQGLKVDIETYYSAITARSQLGARMAAFHEEYDLLITPTMPSTAPKADVIYHSVDYDRWDDAVPYTVPFNLTGQPGASIPVGLAANGLPIGMQIVGPRFSEALILKASRAYEKISGFAQPHPDLVAAVDAIS